MQRRKERDNSVRKAAAAQKGKGIVNKGQCCVFTHGAKRKKEGNWRGGGYLCAPRGQMVKYPYVPLVQRHGPPLCSPSVSSAVLFSCHTCLSLFAARTGALRLSCVRASTSLLLQPPAPFKYQGELRLGPRAPPPHGFHWSASHGVHYR